MSNASINHTEPEGRDSAPKPCHRQRDADERLIAVTFQSQATSCPDTPDDDWLVALDGSEHALQALDVAMRLSMESGKRVLDLVNVQPWLSREAAETELPRRGWAAAAEACARLDERESGWRLHVLMGDPAAGIVDTARSLGSRGIVIGARGLSATASLLLGSVAQQVVHSAERPVLVVRGDAQLQEKRHVEDTHSS
ncbi:universal stress protein [Noviherbaspirillum soli]|uniref:universal stress protein n=1 Tax=Noviherbaspirillum soli TaxID=1064518 RepID=UPI00188AF43C|nr:universal stress protein [Noviherbaspirillum soli]